MTPDEQTAITDGLAGPFWALFKQHAEAEWGQGGNRFALAVKQAAEKQGVDAVQYLRMVLFAQQEIQRLLLWPVEMAARAKPQAAPEGFIRGLVGSRRGPGL
jgi:hypothetical protein